MSINYNDPYGGTQSSIGDEQFNEFFWMKKSLTKAARREHFMPLASTKEMPKHFGKTIKAYLYLPLLDDANVNDQGIDATGATIADGNLYGSSRDIGTIIGKLPSLTEEGGRVNRVGFRRQEFEGSIYSLGFFSEYTEESLNFDTDSELMEHYQEETIRGASEITEDVLLNDIVNSAGIVKYAGAATSIATVSRDDVITYKDIVQLSVDLDNNLCPNSTEINVGSRLTDTRTINSARFLYVSSELTYTLKSLTDFHGNQALIEVQKYADKVDIMPDELGVIDRFRIIAVPQMPREEGKGTATGSNVVYETSGNPDVFPMVIIGSNSFSAISFKAHTSGGKNAGTKVMFKQILKKPGAEIANHMNPYGRKGFMSIQWYYGFLALRPERIAVTYTAALL